MDPSMDPVWILDGSYMDPYADLTWIPTWILCGSYMDPIWILFMDPHGSYTYPYMDPSWISVWGSIWIPVRILSTLCGS